MSHILYGAKSVVFLIASCAPCYDAKRKFDQKKLSKRDRAAKNKLVTEQPGLYHHPSPMQTNPYWAEEIAAGPNFEKGKKPRSGMSKDGSERNLRSSERNLTSAETGGGVSERASGNESKQTLDRSLTSPAPNAGMRGDTSIAPSSPTVGADSRSVLGTTTDDATWNHKLYQREDEGLWGIDIKVTLKAGQRSVLDALNSASTGLTSTIQGISSRLPTFNFPDSSSSSSNLSHPPSARDNGANHPYFVGRNPPLNDLHPAIVSTTPHNKEAMKWMLQPPPPASVMSGKMRVGRERADSGLSGQSVRRTISRASTLPVADREKSKEGLEREVDRLEERSSTLPVER